MVSIRGMSGSLKGQVFQIDGESLTIGRGPDNKVSPEDASVSTRHCVIERDGNKYTLRDLDSTNGTRLNGETVRGARLKPKDIIQVGAVDFMFDGADVEIADQETIERVNGISGNIATAGDAAVAAQGEASSAFGRKRDHRRAVNAAIYLLALLAAAALVTFVLKLFGS